MSCNAISTIQPTECIGNSLVKINGNFSTLHNDVCDVDSQLAGLRTIINSLSSAVAAYGASYVGTVSYYAASTAPTGWLFCNGVTVPNGTGTVQGITANFSALYNVVRDTYGTMGTVPDLRGQFIRGWDPSNSIDLSRRFGSTQQDALQGHWHDFYSSPYADGGPYLHANFDALDRAQNTKNPYANTVGYKVKDAISDGSNGTPRIGKETRPVNVALLPCIKY